MDTEPSELQKYYQRDINCLLDEDRNLRLQALIKIKSDLFKPEVDEKDLKSIFEHGLLRNLLSVVSEKVEKHRELSIDILEAFFVKVKEVDPDTASNILKECVNRMNVLPFPEQSEEKRLRLLKFIRKVLSLGYLKVFTWNLADVANMTAKLLSDPFADIKKEVSQFVTELSTSLKDSIGDYASNIIKELAKNLGHQHNKVRKTTIETLGDILLTKNAANKLEEIFIPLKNATNDKSSEVRKATFQMIARLLNGFAPLVLKTYEGQLVLTLLNGLNDENEEVQSLCSGLLESVGENIKRLEDKVQEEK